MGIHAISYYERYDEAIGAHELTDIDYVCSYSCETEVLSHINMHDPSGELVSGNDSAGTVVFSDGTAIEWGWFPGGSETDYDVYCANDECRTLLWHGLNSA